jgi:hypothetical protein
VARLVAANCRRADQQVVVVNLPGATGAIALDRVAHSPADGYSLIVISAADTILPLRANLPFDLRRDLPVVPASPARSRWWCIGLPVRSVKDLVALAQSSRRAQLCRPAWETRSILPVRSSTSAGQGAHRARARAARRGDPGHRSRRRAGGFREHRTGPAID